MSRFGIALAVVTLLAVPALSHADGPGAVEVSLIDGDVQVRIPETGEWAPASINMPLLEDDEVWVPDGDRAELRLNNGSYVRLGGGTALQLLRTDSNSFQFSLTQGRAYVLARGPRLGVIQLDTPSSSVRGYGLAIFRVDVPDGETDVAVYKGAVVAENEGGETRVNEGNALVLGADGYAELSPLAPADEWEEWNAQRDRRVLASRAGSRYLPPELRAYASDFDDNGRWVRVEEYGYVWTPTVMVIANWAPYRHGRWVFRGGDYIWISYDPWGWTPYHYGRWAFVASFGWCWVPPERGQVHWGPGYVGWVRRGDYVGWVPLAPREIYYGRGDYGRYSVNVTNVNITNIRVTNVYRNVDAVNSVTVVNRTTFVTGRPAPVDRGELSRVRQDFKERRNVIVGRPEIRPAPTSYVPVVRSVPEAKRPPAPVRDTRVGRIKEGRPLVREPERSAIRPGAPPKPLEVRRSETPRAFPDRGREGRTIQPGAAPERPAPGRGREGQPAQGPPQERVGPAAPPARTVPAREPAGRPQPQIQERGRPAAPPERTAPAREPAGRPQPPPQIQERPRPAAPPERTAPAREPEVRPARPQAPPQVQERPRPAAPPERTAPAREPEVRPAPQPQQQPDEPEGRGPRAPREPDERPFRGR